MAQEYNPQDQISYDLALKLRDLEESQKLSKERLLLIGKNIIEFQEKNSSEMIYLKKTLQELKTEITRIKSIVQTLSEEISKSARKEELAILERQYKMFKPLNFARIEDIEQIIDKKLHHKTKEEKPDFWSGKL